PGRALAFARGDELQRRAAVARELLALAAGRASTQAIAHAWAADEPEARLEHAARQLAQAAAGKLGAYRDGFDPAWDMQVLQQGFERANRLREQLRGPLRPEPALVEFLASLSRAS
ncbi:MAG: DNA polymerase III subunit delta', partial [Pseudomonadota bacterium]|nr:DNA polymerase III subunit delta' [Pseudomonadota bacterium]